MDALVKNLHVFIILYALYNVFTYYEIMDEKLVQSKDSLVVSERKLTKVKRDLVAVRKFQENLEESKKRVREVVAKIEEMQKQLPSDIQDTEVTGRVTEFANDLKMVAPSASPKEEKNNKFYFSKDYEFSAQGTYLQSLIFFEKLENLAKSDRILNVKYVKMVNSENADPRSRFKILKIETMLEAYRYNTSYDPTKDISE